MHPKQHKNKRLITIIRFNMPRKYNKKMNNCKINTSALLPKSNDTDELTEFEIRMYNNRDVHYIGDRDNGIKKIFVLDDEFCSWYALDKLETKRICRCGIFLIKCYRCERHVLQCYSCHYSLESNDLDNWKYNQFIQPILMSSCDQCCA